MSKKRRHKQHGIGETCDMFDHISNLPDCILHRILSFMPTEEAVKTSILSTRWKNLWAFGPNIDIDDILLCATHHVTSFVNFVERVLRLRDALNTEKFSLSCYVFRDASIIQSWISHAIMHNVQELHLSLFATKDSSVIPRSLFDSSTSLVILEINMDCAIQLPCRVSFPCLKTLYLSDVTFPDDDDFTEKLFSGCTVLEELVLFRCCLLNLRNVVISSSTLKSLTISDWLSFEVLENPTSGCKMKIDATNLSYFKYVGCLSNEIILSNTPSLDKSFIDISSSRGRRHEVECRAIDLLKQLQYVVSLSLSNDTLKALTFAYYIRFPVFPKLTHLMLTKEVGMNPTFRVLMRLLSFCPLLQSICFSEGFMFGMDLHENNSILSPIPICILNSLKTVTFKYFHAYDSEICFLKFFFKYAHVLERMDIWWSKTELQDVKRKTKVMKRMEKIERSSKACVINFL